MEENGNMQVNSDTEDMEEEEVRKARGLSSMSLNGGLSSAKDAETRLQEDCQTLNKQVELSLVNKAPKKSVRLVYNLRHLIPKAAPKTVSLLYQAFASPLYLGMEEGRKILKEFVISNSEAIHKLNEVVQKRMLTNIGLQSECYGKLYYALWHHSVLKKCDDLNQCLRFSCVQDLVKLAISDNSPLAVGNARSALSHIIIHKKDTSVMDLLYFYEALLWRHVKDPNNEVRKNTAQLFLDLFPLEDPSGTRVKRDQDLTKHLLIIKDLLTDKSPHVRATTVAGLLLAMNLHWEIFPEDMIRTFTALMANDLCCDSSSPDVRLAVVKGLIVLLENPLSHEVLGQMLLNIRHLFHDCSEEVRLAFCQVLLRVKRISSIKYYHIVSVDHLLLRLEEDAAMVKPIVALIYNSYFPPTDNATTTFHRCIELIKANQRASRIFFNHVSYHVPLSQVAEFMRKAVDSLHFYVVSTQTSAPLVVASHPESPSPTPVEALGLHLPHVVSGLLVGLVILWVNNQAELEKPENKHHMKLIVKKFSKCLGDLSVYYKDCEVWPNICFLGSFMPQPSIPTLAPLCFKRLSSLSLDAEEADYITLLDCLCKQKGPALVEFLEKRIEDGLKENFEGEAGQKGKFGIKLLKSCLDQRSRQKALLVTCADALSQLLQFIGTVQTQVDAGSNCEHLGDLLLLLIELAVLLQGEDNCDAVSLVEDVANWLQQKKKACFSPLIKRMSVELCEIMVDMTLLEQVNLQSNAFMKFAMNILQSDTCVLLPTCRLLLRHVTLGKLHHELLVMVEKCFKLVVDRLCYSTFFSDATEEEKKEIRLLLTVFMLDAAEEILRSFINSALQAVHSASQTTNASVTNQKKLESLDKVALSPNIVCLLGIICNDSQFIKAFLLQFKKHLTESKIKGNAWTTILAVIYSLHRSKKCSPILRQELMKLIEIIERKMTFSEVSRKHTESDEDPIGDQSKTTSSADNFASLCNKLKKLVTEKKKAKN